MLWCFLLLVCRYAFFYKKPGSLNYREFLLESHLVAPKYEVLFVVLLKHRYDALLLCTSFWGILEHFILSTVK